MKQVRIVENVMKLNDELAAENRRLLREHGVWCFDLIGAPGCGKTALLEATLGRLAGELTVGIAVGDLATARDAERLAQHTDHVVQINTGRACHLEAHQVRRAMDQLPLAELDLLVVENVGNLICPVGFDLGQHLKVGMFSVSEGDDKAAKHWTLVHAASLILLNKTDLLPHIPFDRDKFHADVAQLNAEASVMELSATAGALDAWLDWLRHRVRADADAASAT
jgi:hydrogenase nickel incorporation protein HypB